MKTLKILILSLVTIFAFSSFVLAELYISIFLSVFH